MDLTQDEKFHLSAVMELGKTCKVETEHTRHVTFLALRLFDELAGLHHFGRQERFWLQCAGLLHDIGWVEGWKAHHKVSARMIIDTPMLNFSSKERLIIASIARYHRKALPSLSHDHFAALEPSERNTVSILASFLRMADGLDHSHQSRIRDLACKVSSQKITLRCIPDGNADEEIQKAEEKSDLFQQVFQKRLVILLEAK
jgi:exopolyphosphatase/guanosine-5'-triphosphate,3'-diphosphate pyrophosphatase